MTQIMAIDPGHTESAYVVVDHRDLRPIRFGKVPNEEMMQILAAHGGPVYIEMIASYGMAVGAEVFETCVWIGRFVQLYFLVSNGKEATRIFRKPIKRHLCGVDRAKDANIIQALRDRFAYGQSNYGKGTKAEPGFFYGFKADCWQAYALAVYAVDECWEVPF